MFNIAVFLHLQKAFDTINHDIMLEKLKLYGLEEPSMNLLSSYLANRAQLCSVNGVLSGLLWNSTRFNPWASSISNLYKRFTPQFGILVAKNVCRRYHVNCIW